MGVETVLAYTVLAGLAIPFGGLLARAERLRMGHFRTDLLTTIVAFGGGLVVAAATLVLIPHGVAEEALGPAEIAFLVGGGGVLFLLVDRAIERRGGKAGNFLATTMDLIPESIALGAAFALGTSMGPLLAILVGLQNLPEGFNSYRELHEGGSSSRRIMGLLLVLALLNPLAALVGFFVLGGFPVLLAALFLLSSGGILYLVFHDVAPTAYAKGHWLPTLGVIAGFLVGLIGERVLGG
jgi:ZIP family zinc transporter